MSRGRLLKGGAWLSAGNGVSAIFFFLRNIAIARLVSVGDFGIVVLLSMALSVIEAISNLAIDRLLIQAPDGDAPKLQAVAHALQVVRGIVGGLIMFLLAPLLASLFKVPQAAWAFEVLALTPVVRSFVHLDTIRMQRDMRFRPTFWVVALPPALSLVLAVPLAYWFRDYSAIVWAIILQSFAQVAISHFLSDRPYRWAWDRATIRRIVSFGWPLLANGMLVFAIFQGDKAIVAAKFTPEVVGWYGAAFMLSLSPAMLVTSTLQSLLLPMLSRHQDNPGEFALRSEQTIQLCLGVGLFVAIVFLVLGPELLVLIFGDRYRAGTEVVILLGVAQGIRTAKAGPFISSIALAQTKDILIANLARAASLLLAVILVTIGFGPLMIAATGTIGEIVSYLLAVFLVANGNSHFIKQQVRGLSAAVILLSLSYGVGTELRSVFPSNAYYAIAVLWILLATIVHTVMATSMRQSRPREIGQHDE